MRANLKLMPYQEDGVRFLTSGYHKLLADDMGLGKTIQVIAAAFNTLHAKQTIIVCPAAVKYHWARQIVKWSHTAQTIFVITNGKAKIPPHASVIIVNYELLLRDPIYKQLVARGQANGFDVVVCDEAHYLKSLTAKRTKRVLGVQSFIKYSKYKWMLTGTPVLNRPSEIFPLLCTLAPEVIAPYSTWNEFGKYFCAGHEDQFGAWDMSGQSNIPELTRRMEGFMLRRKKEDVLDQLPDKVETIIELDVCEPIGLEDAPMSTVRKELAVAKIPEAVAYIGDMAKKVGKVVVFAHHRDVIKGLQEGLREYQPVIVFGGMTAEQKQASVDSFIYEEATQIFIAQTLAGGTGIDGLQEVCQYVVFVELDWSPGIMDQAVDRLRRIGQRNTVFVQYLAVPGSLDTVMAEVLEYKRDVITKLLSVKEVIPMSENKMGNAFELAAQSLNAISLAMTSIAGLMHTLAGGQPVSVPAQPATVLNEQPATKPAATKPKNTKPAAAPATPDPKVEAPAPAATPASPLSVEEVRKATSSFVGSYHDRDVSKGIVVNTLLPKYGAAKLDELQAEHFVAFVQDLNNGVEFYLNSSDAGADDLAGI